MKHRFLVILLICGFVLAACNSQSATQQAGGSTEGGEVAGLFRVAVILPSAINDLAFSQSMYDALVRIQAEEGEENFEFTYTENVSLIEDGTEAMRDYADQGYTLIIAHGSQFGSSVEALAREFPETSFAWGTSIETFSGEGVPNVYAYEARAEEGGYVNGVMASLLSESGTVGVIGPLEVGDAKLYIDGFTAGALATNPDIEINPVYTGSFSDVPLASEMATQLVDDGADALTGTAQMVVGAVSVAEDEGIPWWGTQSNQTTLAPEIVVASQVYRWDVVLRQIITQIRNGKLGGQSYEITLANGGLVIEYNEDYDLPDEVRAAADEALQGIIDSTIMVELPSE